MKSKHETKRKRPLSNFKCDVCGSCFNTNDQLIDHLQGQHAEFESKNISVSSSSSPPRKKPALKDMNLESTEEHLIYRFECGKSHEELENRIKSLEKSVVELQNQLLAGDKCIKNNEKDNKAIAYMDIDNSVLTETNSPAHKNHETDEISMNINASGNILPVHPSHVSLLKGYKSYFQVTGDGACLTNCASVHFFGTENNGPKLKKRLDHHIADNWDYYKDYIPLPYKETIGVGKAAREIEIHEEEEYLSFLRNDESLKVYTDSHEILALANLFKISIHIFSFGGKSVNWNHVSPDTNVDFNDINEHAVETSDMALYHNWENHFDLLIKENSGVEIEPQNIGNPSVLDSVELLLCDDIDMTKDEKAIDDVVALTDTPADIVKASEITKDKSEVKCNFCANVFSNNKILQKHVENKHSKDGDCTCDNCPFQGEDATTLLRHLQITQHQPGINVKDKRQLLKDPRECYTCKMVFDGFIRLMNHRKNTHPSTKQCKNFLAGLCQFESEC